MSTTSTVTASVAWDWIPSDKVEILNHMCVLVLTRDDGTPYDAASIQEEDIIEICVKLRHTPPKGVFHYSAGKLVMLFQSMDKMLVTAHGVIKAMAFHDEPIRLRMSPPSSACAQAFIAVRDGEPSDTQPPTPDKGEEPLPSPNDPHLGERTPHQLQANLVDFADNELQKLMEDLCKVTFRELNAPPRDPPLIPWGNPVGNRDPDVDDWEVTFLRGEGGNPQDNHFDPCSHPTRQRCKMSYIYTGHWFVTWYPSY